MRTLAALLSLAAFTIGCAPRPRAVHAQRVSWSTEMQSNRSYIPALLEGVRRSACTIDRADAASFVAVCYSGVVIYALQHERKVVRGCSAPATPENCLVVWKSIADAIPRAPLSQ